MGVPCRVNRQTIKNLGAFLLISLLLASCAGTGLRPKSELTVSQIVSAGMQEIDLGSNRIVCTGKQIVKMDRVEGTLIKGVLCEESAHMSFLYLFNDDPFFFAITEINQRRDEMKPLMGFGAMEQREKMLPVDLESKPRLPAWAYDSAGRPIKSIYERSGDQGSGTPDRKN